MRDGVLFNGELSATNASATVVPLYGPDRKRITINPTDRVVVTDVVISPSTDCTLDLFFSTDGTIPTGGKIVSVSAAANGGIALQFGNEHWGLIGESVYFQASTVGVFKVSVRGRIVSRKNAV